MQRNDAMFLLGVLLILSGCPQSNTTQPPAKPKSGGKVVPAKPSDFKPHGPFVSDKAYREEIKLEGGNPKGKSLTPDWSIKDWWNYE